MSDKPPRVPIQTEPTLVIDRSRVLSAEARAALRDAPTLVECPWCEAQGMVKFEKRVEWITAYPELQRSPSSRPTNRPPPEKP